MMEAGREEGGQTSGVSEAQEGLEAVEKEGAGRKEEEEGKGDVREGDHGDAGGGGELTTAVMEVKKKSGRAKKKEKRLKSEPPSLTGKCCMVCSMNQNMCAGEGEGDWMGVCVSAYVEDSVPLCVCAWESGGRCSAWEWPKNLSKPYFLSV